MSVTPGHRLDGYELLEPLGAGGMGEVWLARDPQLARTVAVKLLPLDLVRNPDRLARFQREARAASSLNHPNICTIFALGQEPGGRPYLVMEYVEGETVRRRLAEHRVSLADTLATGVGVAAALTAAHAQGIVHRDVKPDNIMIRRDGLVKVLDFGLAKLVAPSESFDEMMTAPTAVTLPGAVVGSVAYMSPEQARAEPVDHRTDIWGLGIVLYEMATGQLPFRGKSATDVLVGILERDPPPVTRFDPDAPPEFQRIVSKALRKDPEERYQTARDLMLDLQALQDELKLRRSAPGGAVAAAGRRKRRLGIAAAVLAVMAAAGAAAVWWWPRSQDAAAAGPSAPGQRRLTRLTFGSGLQTDVTWSPDSRFVAYASDQAGNFDIWVQPVAGGDPVRVTHSEMPDTQPDWSPDGTRIVFRSERDGGGLFLVPVLGGTEQRLTSQGSRPRWSPDGRQVLFVPGQDVPGAKDSRLQVVGLDGSAPREVLTEFALVIAAEWHPDGRVSVLGSHRAEGFGFYTVNLDGTALTRMSMAAEAEREAGIPGWVEFAWAPDGLALYVEVIDGGVQNLWTADVEPGSMTITRVERLTTGPTRDSQVSVSRDGRRLAYSAYSESARLWSLPLDAGTGRVTGVPAPFTDEGVQVSTSDAAPDERHVVYVVQRPGNLRRDLWLADLDRGTSRPLFQDGFERDFPRWSPDGKRIVYMRAPARLGNRTLEIVVGDLEGRERVVLTADLGPRPRPPFLPFDWTADARHLLGSSSLDGETTSAITLWPADGPQVQAPARVLLEDSGYDFWQTRYSPDRRLMSFVYVPARGGGYPQVAVAPVSDLSPGRWQRIGGEQGWTDKPRWSPDGRLLYYLVRDEGARFNVWATRVDGATGAPAGRPFQVTRLNQPDLLVSPDMDRAEMSVSGHRLILTVKKVTGSVWVLEGIQ